jgi:hypothetical protein
MSHGDVTHDPVAVTLCPTRQRSGADVDNEALRAYADSGDDDWSRDLALLTEKVEVEALGPQRLRGAVITAIEEALDIDALERAREGEQAQRERLREMRALLKL